MRPFLTLATALFSALCLSTCSRVLHEPAADLSRTRESRPWLVHCESGLIYEGTPAKAGRAQKRDWIWAEDSEGRPVEMYGRLRDGFLLVDRIAVRGLDGPAPYATVDDLRRACAETLARQRRDRPLELGKIRAARDDESINVAFELPAERASSPPKSRLVVFGDSLSDAGKLRRRLRVFPLAPYWLGRFSNGPVWTDYLENQAGLAIQNHAHGGSSMTRHPHVRTANMLAMLRDGGQFFLTGSVDVQVSDYLARNVRDASVHEPDRVVYTIWAGANDYIWKEPFSGEIDTFLNDPKQANGYGRVVAEVIEAFAGEVRRLHDAGARNFLVPNLPDLGRTPIVLQNRTYFPRPPVASEEGRKLELSRRLSALSALHNRSLAGELDRLRGSLAGVTIVSPDVASMIDLVLAGRAPGGARFDYGFELRENARILGSGTNGRHLQDRCYHGGYFGSFGDMAPTCRTPERALFWDVVHPGSYTHCWLAWFFRSAMSPAGWIAPAPSLDNQRTRCERAVAIGTAFFAED